ncbi:MAG: cytochrome P450 [Actinomycetota bacterium]|nr:cytochrome P450 [Actinomycetota bacterium]
MHHSNRHYPDPDEFQPQQRQGAMVTVRRRRTVADHVTTG